MLVCKLGKKKNKIYNAQIKFKPFFIYLSKEIRLWVLLWHLKLIVKKENTRTASTNFVVVSYFHLWTQFPHHLSRFLFFVLTFSGHNIICNCLEKQIFEEKHLHLSLFIFSEIYLRFKKRWLKKHQRIWD